MGRSFAGILGAVAFVVVLSRGLMHGAAVDQTLVTAAVQMFLFAVFGYWVGKVADRTVLDSLCDTIARQGSAALDQPHHEIR
jgi:heme/copper-type cytochrome/quinol oxidase subunit 4